MLDFKMFYKDLLTNINYFMKNLRAYFKKTLLTTPDYLALKIKN